MEYISLLGDTTMFKRLFLAIMVFGFLTPFTLSAEQNWDEEDYQEQSDNDSNDMSAQDNEAEDSDANFEPEEAPESSEEYEEPDVH